jgi:hypothetical protein
VGEPVGKNHLEDLGVEGIMIIKRTFNMQDGDVDWIYISQERGKWPAVVKTVMNIQFA